MLDVPSRRTRRTLTSEDVISFFLIFNFCRDTTEVKIPSLPCIRHLGAERGSPPIGLVAEGGQATQGTRWMPWRQEPMKDVVGSEMPRGAASMH